MKIAFPTRNDQTISGHFGKMKAFIVVEVVGGVETSRERRDMSEMPACGSGHGEKPKFVIGAIADCDVLIAGGMGTPIRDRATGEGLEVVLTRESMIASALNKYLDGTLEDLPQLAHGH